MDISAYVYDISIYGVIGQFVINASTLEGTQGLQGIQGIQGTQGLQGTQGIQGLQGITGTDGTSLINKGTWISGTTYNPGDYVFYDVSSGDTTQAMFILVGDNPYVSTIAPYDDTTYWNSFEAPQGAQGIQGIQGLQGVQGTQGTQGTQGLQGTQGIQGMDGYVS